MTPVNKITDSERLIKVELTSEFHAQRLGLLENQAGIFSKALKQIEGNLNQIKWIGYGAVAGYLVHSLGLSKVIEKVMM